MPTSEPVFDTLRWAVARAVGGRVDATAGAMRTVEGQERLIRLATQHRCLMLAVTGIESRSSRPQEEGLEFVPEARVRIQRILASLTARAAFLSERLVALMEAFEAAGLRALALKGPAMSQSLYGRVDCRPSDDLDVWVHPADFLRASDAMESMGFVPLVRLSPTEAKAHMEAGWDRAYASPAADYVVELCAGIAPRYFAQRPDPEALWAGARTVLLPKGIVRVPSPDSLLLLLCMHGAKHVWSRLLWVADIARLAADDGGVEWGPFERQARRVGAMRMTALGLRMAEVGLGANVPRWPCSIPVSLERQAWRSLSGAEPCVGSMHETRFHLAARERWRDRLRHLVLAALTPGFGDWRWVMLPSAWFWAYAFLRPFRLIARIFGNLKTGGRQC